MVKSSDFSKKEVINMNNGKRLGVIVDMEFDLQAGRITSIVVPGPTKMLGILRGGNDYVIPWDKIKKIGDDVILVDMPTVQT